MLAPCSPCPIWICALQPQSSKSQREVTLTVLLPGFCIKPPPVYLPSAGITLNAHLSHAARLGKSLLCLPVQPVYVSTFVCVCVWEKENGTEGERAIKRIIVFVCVFLWGGFIFTCEGTFMHECLFWHRKHFISFTDRMVCDFLGSHIHEQTR